MALCSLSFPPASLSAPSESSLQVSPLPSKSLQGGPQSSVLGSHSLRRLVQSKGFKLPLVLMIPPFLSQGHTSLFSRLIYPSAHCSLSVDMWWPSPACPTRSTPTLPQSSLARPPEAIPVFIKDSSILPGFQGLALVRPFWLQHCSWANQACPCPKALAWVFPLKYLNDSLSHLLPLLAYIITWPPP